MVYKSSKSAFWRRKIQFSVKIRKIRKFCAIICETPLYCVTNCHLAVGHLMIKSGGAEANFREIPPKCPPHFLNAKFYGRASHPFRRASHPFRRNFPVGGLGAEPPASRGGLGGREPPQLKFVGGSGGAGAPPARVIGQLIGQNVSRTAKKRQILKYILSRISTVN